MTFIFAIIRVLVNLGNLFSVNSAHYPLYIIAYIFAESGIMIYLAVFLLRSKKLKACLALILYYIASRIAVLALLYYHGFYIQSGLAADIFVIVLYSLLMLPGAIGASSYKKLQNTPGYPAGYPAPYYTGPAGPYQQPYPMPGQPPYEQPPGPYQQPGPAQPPGPYQQPYPNPEEPGSR